MKHDRIKDFFDGVLNFMASFSDEVVARGWFGRTPEPKEPDLGWFQAIKFKTGADDLSQEMGAGTPAQGLTIDGEWRDVSETSLTAFGWPGRDQASLGYSHDISRDDDRGIER